MLHLLSETDTGSGIEWKEDEGVWHKVLCNTVVEETVRVELLRWERTSGQVYTKALCHEQRRHTSRTPVGGVTVHVDDRVRDAETQYVKERIPLSDRAQTYAVLGGM